MRDGVRMALPILLAAVATAAVSPLASTATAAEDKPSWCTEEKKLDAKKLPKKIKKSDCDLTGRVVTFGDVIAVDVPPPGMEASAEALMLNGSDQTIAVATSADASEYDLVTPDGVSTPDGVTGGPQPCNDPFYRGAGYKIVNQLGWYYNHTGAVTNLTNVQIAAGIKKGADNMVLTRNDCNDPRVARSSHSYLGGTPRGAANINADGSVCSYLPADGINVVAWRTMPTTGLSARLAVACTLRNMEGAGPNVVEAEWALNRAFVWDETTLDGCSNAWVISSVMTHEWGHTVGLDHADEATHGLQTMSTKINAPCGNDEQTLAQGEVDAMIIKYGAR